MWTVQPDPLTPTDPESTDDVLSRECPFRLPHHVAAEATAALNARSA